MKANCWYGTHDVRIENVPDPKIINPRDAIVRITSTAICGSDLHLYNGYIPAMERGDILGHEFMGEIVEVGSAITNLKVATAWSFPFRSPVEIASSVRSRCIRCAKTPIRMHGWRRNYGVTRHRGFSAIPICSAAMQAGKRVCARPLCGRGSDQDRKWSVG
jgi:threonine dehydrogenase-like Zn-dependent dehydrogenase